MVEDPVCETQVDPQQAALNGNISTRLEHTYYFCCRKCKEEFDKHPAFYSMETEDEVATDEGMPPVPPMG